MSMHPAGIVVPAEGALLSLPARAGAGRRVWMTQGVGRRAPDPQPGVFSVYAPDFFLDDPAPWLVPDDPAAPDWAREFSTTELLAQIAPRIEPSLPPAPHWELPSEAFFQECFQDLQAEFQAGRLAKVVPVFFEHAHFPAAVPLARWIASALRRAPEALMPYGHWSPGRGFLGASPELLFEIHDGVLRTMALAGTLPAPDAADTGTIEAAEAAFLADSKERREHCLVIEGITDSLAPFGAVKVGETVILKLPTLWHLQTPIQVVLRESPSFEFLVRRLHPTPALGGSPREASLQWLRRQDARQDPPPGRGTFGAPFGAQCPDGSAFCLVALRNVVWDADTLRLGAGCGVIRESRRDREWEELRQKRDSVKGLFGL